MAETGLWPRAQRSLSEGSMSNQEPVCEGNIERGGEPAMTLTRAALQKSFHTEGLLA
jgi:hypothetical protein